MDGTLVDSSYAMTKALSTARRTIGLEPLDRDEVISILDSDEREIPRKLFGDGGDAERCRDVFRKIYGEISPSETKIYDEMEWTLRTLSSMDIHLSVATNASTRFAVNILEGCGIYSLFDTVVGADIVKRPKPYPDMVNHIVRMRDHYSPETTILIGDSHKDMESAHSAGVKPFFAGWGYGKYLSQRDTLLSKPSEIISIALPIS